MSNTTLENYKHTKNFKFPEHHIDNNDNNNNNNNNNNNSNNNNNNNNNNNKKGKTTTTTTTTTTTFNQVLAVADESCPPQFVISPFYCYRRTCSPPLQRNQQQQRSDC